ncbi:hypothetical protein GCM10011571_08290 [Marinithermofilum abyssi]|uniref:Serine/threonine-protein kinase PrkC n=1 Tax=Marinithermofilum abyssi TaxID=1571185 RepID=A0A8J2VGH4_9BACL|nr:hypothetical protein GCM10011571_08290 [Marinithermofilum abyssi]
MVPLEGKRLGGRYEIVGRLGGGGMATVYKAKDLMLERLVAVKVMNESLSHDGEFIQRFMREAKAAASLSHPNVINVYDVGKERSTHYMVMEYMQGSSLMDLIQEYGPFPTEEAVTIAMQVCDGLHHAHEHGIIHRDIKPHNIMATADGRFKVGDFGISRFTGAATITQTGFVMGSVHYFSPEQARGREISHQSDIYSLGVVLYQMVTGALPYDGEEAVAIALQHIQEPVPDPRRINPDVPEELCAIIETAMAKEKHARYASARDMMEDLRHLAGGDWNSAIPSLAGRFRKVAENPVAPRATSRHHRTQTPPSAASLRRSDRHRTQRTAAYGKTNSSKKKWWWTGLATAAGIMLLFFFFWNSGDTSPSAQSSHSATTQSEGKKEKTAKKEGVPKDADSSKEAADETDDSKQEDEEQQPSEDTQDDHNDAQDPSAYPWQNDLPGPYATNQYINYHQVSGADGEYDASMMIKGPQGAFFYDVIVADPIGKRAIATQQPIPNSGDEANYTPANFHISIPQDQLPQEEGMAKVVYYRLDANGQQTDVLEDLLQKWDD